MYAVHNRRGKKVNCETRSEEETSGYEKKLKTRARYERTVKTRVSISI